MQKINNSRKQEKMNPYKYSYWYLMHVVTMLTLYLKCSIYLMFLIF